MRIYVELARLAFHQQLAYRAATIAGVFTNSVFGIILASVMIGFYASAVGPSVAGWSEHETVTLIWINQALIMPVYIWGWWEVSQTIRTGTIATDLLRPVSWYGLWWSRDLGRAVAAMLLRMVPTLAIGSLLFDLEPPRSISAAIAFPLVVLLATWVSFSLRLIANLASFWLIDHRGVAAMFMTLAIFLSGMAMPIAFFPEPLRTIAALLPFQAVLMSPNNVWLEKDSILSIVGQQVFWIGVLALACHAMLLRGERKLVVHGG